MISGFPGGDCPRKKPEAAGVNIKVHSTIWPFCWWQKQVGETRPATRSQGEQAEGEVLRNASVSISPTPLWAALIMEDSERELCGVVCVRVCVCACVMWDGDPSNLGSVTNCKISTEWASRVRWILWIEEYVSPLSSHRVYKADILPQHKGDHKTNSPLGISVILRMLC